MGARLRAKLLATSFACRQASTGGGDLPLQAGRSERMDLESGLSKSDKARPDFPDFLRILESHMIAFSGRRRTISTNTCHDMTMRHRDSVGAYKMLICLRRMHFYEVMSWRC